MTKIKYRDLIARARANISKLTLYLLLEAALLQNACRQVPDIRHCTACLFPGQYDDLHPSVVALSGSVFAQLSLQSCASVGTKINLKFDLITTNANTVDMSINADPNAPLVSALIDNKLFGAGISKKVYKVTILSN